MRLGPVLISSLVATSGALNVAIASIRGSTAATPASGWVRFEQDETDPLADITVHINVTGLTAGEHGFHVHQFGDVRSTTDLSTMSAHFVPFCIPSEVVPDGDADSETGCEADQVHGIPPSVIRQPGDMGNVLIGASRTLVSTIVIGQAKMSLSHSLRSIVGRTVVFHSLRDDGSPPFGNAGVPQAYGVIGMARPADGVTNAVQAPTVPVVDKIICTFEGAYAGLPATTSAAAVSGSALLQLLPERTGVVKMEARIDGLSRDNTHSFHFHQWGDMTVAHTLLGPIYQSNAIAVDAISVDALGVAYFQAEFSSDSLLQHVGRSLTIHAGADTSTPTIAAAACGLAHPRAALDLSGAPQAGSSAGNVSGGAMFMVVLSAMVVAAFLGTACLYYMRLPIPFCGRWLYAHEAKFGSMPPPPPPPEVDAFTTRNYDSQGQQNPFGLRQEKL